MMGDHDSATAPSEPPAGTPSSPVPPNGAGAQNAIVDELAERLEPLCRRLLEWVDASLACAFFDGRRATLLAFAGGADLPTDFLPVLVTELELFRRSSGIAGTMGDLELFVTRGGRRYFVSHCRNGIYCILLGDQSVNPGLAWTGLRSTARQLTGSGTPPLPALKPGAEPRSRRGSSRPK